jgi:hypothetical protein
MFLNLDNESFLSQNEIESLAPSIYTQSAFGDLSSKYTHIPTSRVIEDMEKLNFFVTECKEIKARKRIGFQKHLLIFRNSDLVIKGEDGDVIYPTILISNSHDGTSSFTFQSGIFRRICSNGLVVSTQDFDKMRIRHMNYTFEELQEKIKFMVEQLPLTVESMNKMKLTQLSKSQAQDLAKRSLTTRFEDIDIDLLNIDIDALLEPTRPEDKSNDLFTVFNIIQEKILGGDFTYMSGVKIRKARRVKNFQQDIKINARLYEIANEFVEA